MPVCAVPLTADNICLRLLLGQVYNVPGYREVRSADQLKPLVAKVAVPAFEPRSDVKIQTDEKAQEEDRQSESEWVDQVPFLRPPLLRP